MSEPGGGPMSSLPQEAFGAALAALPHLGPVRLARGPGRGRPRPGAPAVPGLALGIGGAGRLAALAAGPGPPVAGVGRGLDVVYPRRHADLWARVAEAGVVLSEAPLGARPEGWRF